MEQELLEELFTLSEARLAEIPREEVVQEAYRDYFVRTSEFMTQALGLYTQIEAGSFFEQEETALRVCNHMLYADILPEAYGESYANPAYACQVLGDELGQPLSFLYTEIRGMIRYAFTGNKEGLFELCEIFLQMYTIFQDEMPDADEVRKALYWFISDYTDHTVFERVREQLDPAMDFYRRIIMESDLNDLSYLYRYGYYISDCERQTAAYLNSLSAQQIDQMAATFTEGYLRGFKLQRIDLAGKKTVNLRANVGFERMLRAIILQFREVGLEAVIYGEAVERVNKGGVPVGFISSSPNSQFDFDHRQDKGLFLDKALCERIIGVMRVAYETYKAEAAAFAGPALVETFGEKPFEPLSKPEAVHLTEKQQKLTVTQAEHQMALRSEYIDDSSISFSIISYPVPEIGAQFEEIFNETVKVNTLDNDLYTGVQQKITDAMNGAAGVHVLGSGDNKTDLYVALYPVTDTDTQSVFENCVADVNIPAGEVFTTPVLSGTNGQLHVNNVYLNGLNYKNLSIWFKDGLIERCSCSNYEDAAENSRYLKENLLQNHETLPMGEFAIGTNTTAYVMAEKFQIADRLPILIMEKTGPHFAVGDSCYSRCEDHPVYNQDGKEIMARDNEISLKRHSAPEEAYFNVHTDITIPYHEIGRIYAIFTDGRETDIIRDGRFCLLGTEVLNEAFE